jgi:3-deoxy-D-manno-octulosonic-acid transferase
MHADRSDFLPLDERDTMTKVFDAVNPALLICSRGDLWPELASTAAARAVPIAIISATVRSSSRRLWAPVRRALQFVYQDVAWLGATSEGDAERWGRLGVPEASITVTGDTRHDQVLERTTLLQHVRPLLQWSHGKATLVAGSTDAQDEKIILNAFLRVSVSKPNVRLILVPHDCSQGRIHEVLATASRVGVDIEVWDGGSSLNARSCVVVNKVGMLSDIYATGEIAYVGGGFRRGGLHAVVEPAALALPVIVGPLYDHAGDAVLLVKTGGATALPHQAPEDLLTRTWLHWLDQPAVRIDAGYKARGVLQQGASRATATALLSRLSSLLEAGAAPDSVP